MQGSMIDLGGHELRVRVAGSGPPMLFTSTGWGIGVDAYRGLAGLEERFTVAWVDPRGTKPSTRPPDDGWSLDSMAADFDRVRESLGWEQMWVAGHSMGGHLALRYAAAHGEQCSGVLGLCTYGDQDDLYSTEMQTRMLSRREEPWFPAFAEAAERGANTDEEFAQMLTNMLPMYFLDQHRCAEFIDELADVPLSVEAFNYLGANPGMRILEDLSGVDVPVVLVACDGDWICSPPLAQRLNETLSGAELVQIAGCGHFPWLEKPDTFWTELAEAFAALSR